MKKTKRKPGYLGPAFYRWLEYLEAVENVLVKQNHHHGKLIMAINDKAFAVDPRADVNLLYSEMASVHASLASSVRSSVKYRITGETLATAFDLYPTEIDYLVDTVPFRLPYERCTLVLDFNDDEINPDTFVMCIQEQTAPDQYTELNLDEGETFICVNVAQYNPRLSPQLRLQHIPVEFHLQNGRLLPDTEMLYALPDHVTITSEHLKGTLKLLMKCVTSWGLLFNLAHVLQHKSVGVPPMRATHIPKKPRKAKKYPNFEHFVMELPVDATQTDPQGRTCNQPHKRLHQVRGFWRHYKSGKVVWVKPHWRGDEKLGVVKNDYELTLNRNSS